MTEYTADSITM